MEIALVIQFPGTLLRFFKDSLCKMHNLHYNPLAIIATTVSSAILYKSQTVKRTCHPKINMSEMISQSCNITMGLVELVLVEN